MKNINIHSLRRMYYQFRHRYVTMNNAVIVIALVIGASWAWASIGALQRNYNLETQISEKQSEEQVAELQLQSLKYEQNYYKSTEYQQLALKEELGLALPGEKVLVLPPNTAAANQEDQSITQQTTQKPVPVSDFHEWMNFITGHDKKSSSLSN